MEAANARLAGFTGPNKPLFPLGSPKIITSMYPRPYLTRAFVAAFASTLLVCAPGALRAADPAQPVAAAALSLPRPEHPRPDAFRENWLSLNGEWQFEIDEKDDGEARGLISGHDLNSKIVVPFCPESKLSGLGHTDYMNRVWYRRLVELPASMKGKRILLHFGGVDYKTQVYVNGELAGTHLGESAAFGFEITRFLKDGSNEIVVRVADDLRSGLQPGGKQSFTKSQGCVYTRTTGIWQTVWLEAVPTSYVENISVVPDPEHSRALIEASVNGPDQDLTLKAEAFANGKLVGSDSSTGTWRNHRLVLNLNEKKLWSPESPFLYDLKFTLTSGGKKIDELKSYFGLRSVAIEGRRILINGKPVFQRLILDQGFYPDGIWTAPSDAALKHDIEMSQAAGYNGARLHQKVFEPRYLYWADKLGYLVWGEFPNWGFGWKPEGYAPWITEWTEILLQDRNHPSIIGWCPFNEARADASVLQQVVWNVTKAVDPTRPVLETSGWLHTLPNPEVLDAHDYDANPESLRKHWADFFTGDGAPLVLPERYWVAFGSRPPDRGVPFMISEFGGIGWDTAGGWGYGANPKTEEEFYARYKGICDAQLDNPNFFGFCYTQLTDVEQEHNGLFYYDRKPKFDLKRLHDITSRPAAYEKGEPRAPMPALPVPHGHWQVLVGASVDGKDALPFRYAMEPQQGEDWVKEGFDDSRWASGLAPFGPHSKTVWTAGDLYLRRSFEQERDGARAGAVVIQYRGPVEIYLNGRKILDCDSRAQSIGGNPYVIYSVADALKGALKKGTNTLSVHVHRTPGGEKVDLALLAD
jgi:hypothetical protein